jgi:hypothetical protein
MKNLMENRSIFNNIKKGLCQFGKHVLIITLLFWLSGCRKFVELDAPKTLLVTENVFAADETAIAQLTGIYSQMNDNLMMPYRIPFFTGLAGDELTNYSTGYLQVYKNALNPVDAVTNQIWTAAYSYIYQANAVYEGCNQSTTISNPVKKQLMAEALFIRAFWHFYVLNLYGDAPLITTTDYTVNTKTKRTSKNEVYQQIIKDLKNAELDLNVDYVDANSITTSPERVRPNSSTASALLARVYLYTSNYIDAEKEASIIIGNKAIYDTVDIDQVFIANNKEAIWQLMKPMPNNSNNNTWEGFYFILRSKPKTSFQNSSTLSNTLLKAFDSTDKRLLNWVSKFTDVSITPNVDYYFPFKYKVFTSSEITEVSTVFRVAEQYLIRAEAKAQQNKIAEAIADVDVLRQRAGIALIKDFDPDINKEALLDIILQERQRELFAEWGHRWFDLKRTNKIDATMNSISSVKGITWNSTQQLWPLPEKELANNANLVQNPGYN